MLPNEIHKKKLAKTLQGLLCLLSIDISLYHIQSWVEWGFMSKCRHTSWLFFTGKMTLIINYKCF